MALENNIQVSKLLLQESAVYNEQMRRPFETTFDHNIAELIVNRFRNIKNQVATGSIVAGVAEHFMKPSILPDKAIEITGGWGAVRWRANIELQMRSDTGNMVGFVITAYSDPIDRSIQGALNTRMPFYIATITQLRQFNDVSTGVTIPQTGIGSANVVLANNKFGGYSSQFDYTQRPTDVFSFIGQKALDLDTPQSAVYDERTVLSDSPIKSEAKNNVPATFVTKVMSAWKLANESSGMLGGTGFDQLAEAQSMVLEQDAAMDYFLRALRNIRGNNFNSAVTNYFTLEELQKLSPNYHTQSPRVVPLSKEVVEMRARSGVGNDWKYAGPLQRMASMLKDTVPALMMEHMLTRVNLSVSNRAFADGRMAVAWNGPPASFASIDLTPQMTAFENRLIREVLLPLSDNNESALKIDMYMSVDSDSRFTITYGSNPPTEFVAPTFAAPLLSPLVTSNGAAAFKMADDFQSLGEMLNDASTQMPVLKNAFFMGRGAGGAF